MDRGVTSTTGRACGAFLTTSAGDRSAQEEDEATAVLEVGAILSVGKAALGLVCDPAAGALEKAAGCALWPKADREVAGAAAAKGKSGAALSEFAA